MSLDVAAALDAVRAGHEAYEKGDFAGASAAYERALQAGADSAALHYDFGNACYRQGRLGCAALQYEKALRREPGHQDATANLELVRRQGKDAVLLAAEEPFASRVGRRVHPDLAGALLLGGSLLFAAALLARGRMTGVLRVVLLGLALLGVAFAGAGGLFAKAISSYHGPGWAVVTRAEAAVRERPEAGAKVTLELHEGFAVERVAQVGDFVRVELAGGLSGWMEAAALAPVGEGR